MSHISFSHFLKHSKRQIVEDLSVGRGNLWRTGLHDESFDAILHVLHTIPYFGDFSILFLFYSTLTWPHFSHVMHTIFRHFMMYLYSILLSQLSAMCSIMHAKARYLYIMILVRDSFRTDSTLFYSTRVTFLILSIALTTYNHAKRWKKYNKKHYNERHFRLILTGNCFY